ncbi:MAG TPA: ABC transporter substrate-binding protein [Sandaracinaceae bacterium LLY-WYZ-13_1]|nr:ABC transporter substrate-binding protein [Sandaracinaceae bacterium LLY-WYZ-13_1]
MAVRTLDPARTATPFEATLAQALFDGLYEVRPEGGVAPVLAAGPPEVEGTVARIRLRPGIRHHGGRPLEAEDVVDSLTRVASVPEARWLLGAFATENGAPQIRAVDAETIEIGLARHGVRADLILASAPFAILAGGRPGRRPLGTGPFRARLDGRGGVDLHLWRHAADRPPWLDHVRFEPPQPRDDEVRAFELGRLDGSWWGRSLYGGEPVRPAQTTGTAAATPVLLVPRRAGALRSDAAWGGVVASIDRARLERVGLVPRRSLGAGLPPPDLPRGRARRGTSLRMIVRAGRARALRLAEAIAGMLDERGVRLQVQRMSDARYAAALRRGAWNLRLAFVRPPLPGRGAVAGAALAAAGQPGRARDLVPSLGDRAVAARTARQLDAMVLGHERIVLHHRADLRGVRFDFLGRLGLAELSFARPEEPLR